ncbi:MAG: rhomboid family intramembrane serine protease [Acidobacteria bacterium]|nr:rhomboid family intramembrane serine protease [Acidobacteriota bacterium]
MAYGMRSRYTGYSYSGYVPLGIKYLLIITTAVFVVDYMAAALRIAPAVEFLSHFKLYPILVVKALMVWQLVSYLFLHGDIMHILFNMLGLWMFGADVEREWGMKRFLRFYFLCGAGAGVCVVAANFLFGDPRVPTIGASGAVYGVMMAYGMLFPTRTVLFSFLFPIQAKYLVLIMGGISFLMTFGASGSGVSHVAHLGGMIFGYIAIRSRRGFKTGNLLAPAKAMYKRWRVERARRKFQVYMRKQGRDPGDWTQ